MRFRRARFGIGPFAAALVTLMMVAIVGSWASDQSAAHAERAVSLGIAYQKAASGVAAEESLERKYRLEPGPVPLTEHLQARQRVLDALADVQWLGSSEDRAIVTRLRTEHDAYVRALATMFAAVDRGAPAATVNEIDGNTVDPVFDAMQAQISAASTNHEQYQRDAIASVHLTNRVVLAIDAAAVLAGMTLIAAAAVSLSRSQRRITAQSAANQFQALHDTLTGLPNRVLFHDRAAHAIVRSHRSGEQVAVMLVDLDRFKDVNDTLGHRYGDLLLAQVAQRFHSTLRAGDSVARLGGDEFAVLLCGTNPEAAIAAAARLTAAIEDAFFVEDISLDVEASIGIALVEPDDDVETALRHADVAMYEAKAHHLPYVTYEATRDDNTVARLGLLGDLRRAIAAGELVLQFQPKIDTTTGDLHSVEALVRWAHPRRGLLMPAEFIPVAEATAVIHPLTTEILRLALAQARAWLDQGWDISVSVNISARSLHDVNFPAEVQHQLEMAGLAPHHLSLELTEGAIMMDPARALVALRALDAMGIRLSIDDFGTGYSSMSYLKNLPVRELKIDQSFVRGMNGDDSDLVLVQSAVDLGHHLGLHVVAEGVEDAATQDALTAMGCDLVQGFHIRRPASAVELDVWLHAHPPVARGKRSAADDEHRVSPLVELSHHGIAPR